VAASGAAAAQEAPQPPHRHRQAPDARAVQGQRRLAYDFVFDTTAEGRDIKCLTVIDEYTRECLAIEVAGSILVGYPLAT
jgi:putative transposase